MARVVVDVMLKPEILDPQGKAVQGALPRLGFSGVTDVRQGKRFELELDGEVTEERLAEVRRAAETLLANTVIETFDVRVEPTPELAAEDHQAGDDAAEEDGAEEDGAEEDGAEEDRAEEDRAEPEEAELATQAR